MDKLDIGYQVKYFYLDGKMTMYRLYQSRSWYIQVKVDRQAEISVYANKNFTDKEIEHQLTSTYKRVILWYQKHNERSLINLEKNIIHIFNKKYVLKKTNKKLPKKFEILGSNIYINLKDESDQKEKLEIVKTIYDASITNYIKNSAKTWANKMGLPLYKIKFRWLVTMWGCCKNTKKEILYAYQLGAYSKDVIDSVIVHELCHIKFPHHQKTFWDEVYKWNPKNKELSRILNLVDDH